MTISKQLLESITGLENEDASEFIAKKAINITDRSDGNRVYTFSDGSRIAEAKEEWRLKKMKNLRTAKIRQDITEEFHQIFLRRNDDACPPGFVWYDEEGEIFDGASWQTVYDAEVYLLENFPIHKKLSKVKWKNVTNLN